MSDLSQGPGWWLASDGKWYAPELASEMHDFEDGNGPVLAQRHPNGGGWVADTASVARTAFVGPEAAVFVFARVHDYATVTDTAWVLGNAEVSGHARIAGDAEVNGDARVGGDADIGGNAFVADSATVDGHAQVGGNARILEQCTVSGNARVFADSVISGDVEVSGENRVMATVPASSGAAVSPQGSGWRQGSDGNWYAPEPSAVIAAPRDGQRHSVDLLPVKRRRKWPWIVAIGLVVLVAALVVVVNVTNEQSPTTSSSGIPNGPSLASLTSSVQAQIVGTGTGNFNITGVASVVCNPPDLWKAGTTFTCYAYDSKQVGVGEYFGTVEPNAADGSYQWNAQWIRSP